MICSNCNKNHPGPTKTCVQCLQYFQNWRASHRIQYRKATRKYKRKHPTRMREAMARYRTTEKGKRATHNYSLRRLYGITLEYKEQMYVEQKGLCALCEQPLPPVIQSHYDHDHKTGKGRGLVHKLCNTFIGVAERTPIVIENIRLYLYS